jgi:hypothetical protein
MMPDAVSVSIANAIDGTDVFCVDSIVTDNALRKWIYLIVSSKRTDVNLGAVT